MQDADLDRLLLRKDRPARRKHHGRPGHAGENAAPIEFEVHERTNPCKARLPNPSQQAACHRERALRTVEVG